MMNCQKDGSHEVEMEILGRHRKHFVKWHMALVEDPCLWIVPGSHRRYRTDLERERTSTWSTDGNVQCCSSCASGV